MRNKYLLKQLKNMGVIHITSDGKSPIQNFRALYKDFVVTWLVRENLDFPFIVPWLIDSVTPKGKIVKHKKYFHVSTLKNFQEFQSTKNPDFFVEGAHIATIAELTRYLKNK